VKIKCYFEKFSAISIALTMKKHFSRGKEIPFLQEVLSQRGILGLSKSVYLTNVQS